MSLLRILNKYINLLLLVPLLYLYPFLNIGVPITHDGENQLARFAAYYLAYSNGHIPPRWADNLNYGYGTPVLNFFYPLPGTFAAFFHFLGFSFENSVKIIFFISTLTTSLFFYLWIRQLTSKYTAITTSLMYSTAPYQLLNIFVRGDIGESLALSFVPMQLFFLERYKKTENLQYALYAGIALSLVILSHHGIGLMFFPLMLGYMWIRINLKKYFNGFLITLIFGFGLSAYFWIPALIEHRYTLATLFIGNMYKDHFINFQDIFIAPWGFNANVNAADGQSPQLGIIITLLFLVAVLSFIKNITNKQKDTLTSLRLLLLIGIGISIFLTLGYSNLLWNNILILKKYQFPWRFIALATFMTSSFIAIQLQKITSKFMICIIIVVIISSIHMTRINGYTHKNDEFYSSFPGTTFFHEEATTIWSTGSASNYPKNHIEIISGSGHIENFKKNAYRKSFVFESDNIAQLLVNTYYYPGWTVYINNKQTLVEYQDTNHRGLITFFTPPGKNNIEIVFTETKLRLASNIITLFSIVVLLIFITVLLIKNIFFIKK